MQPRLILPDSWPTCTLMSRRAGRRAGGPPPGWDARWGRPPATTPGDLTVAGLHRVGGPCGKPGSSSDRTSHAGRPPPKPRPIKATMRPARPGRGPSCANA